MRVVADTNILVSAHLSKTGSPAQFWQLWREDKFTLIASPFLIKEIEAVLNRSKIYKNYQLSPSDRKLIVNTLNQHSALVYPLEVKPVVAANPSDDHVLAAAITGKADVIVSGDKHLLNIKSYQQISIKTLTAFLKHF